VAADDLRRSQQAHRLGRLARAGGVEAADRQGRFEVQGSRVLELVRAGRVAVEQQSISSRFPSDVSQSHVPWPSYVAAFPLRSIVAPLCSRECRELMG